MMKKLSLFVLLCFVLCVFSGVPARVHAATWWDSSYNYKMKLTIDQTKVDADLTDFPVLVYLNSSRINWAHVRDDLKDIRFIDSTETTELWAELENYTVNDEAWMWVKIPIVDDAVDTDFYMYYGNTGMMPAMPYWSPHDVWDSSAVMVQHMVDNPDSSHIMDSTSYSNDGTKKGADEPVEMASGKIDSAQDFDGDNDYIETVAFSLTPNKLTMCSWVYLDTIYDAREIIGSNIYSLNGYIHLFTLNDQLMIGYYAGGYKDLNWLTLVTDNNWICFVVIQDFDNLTATVYKNGALVSSKNMLAGAVFPAWSFIKVIGSYDSSGIYNNFNGIIDEVRIYNVAKSDAWIKADYNSGADTLLTYGAGLTSLTVYYNSGINKLYINGTLATNGTVITTFFNKNVNATATTKPKYVFLKHLLGLTQTSATPTYIFNMTTSNTLWAYAIASETAGASSGALIFTALLALIILIPFLWWRRRR